MERSIRNEELHRLREFQQQICRIRSQSERLSHHYENVMKGIVDDAITMTEAKDRLESGVWEAVLGNFKDISKQDREILIADAKIEMSMAGVSTEVRDLALHMIDQATMTTDLEEPAEEPAEDIEHGGYTTDDFERTFSDVEEVASEAGTRGSTITIPSSSDEGDNDDKIPGEELIPDTVPTNSKTVAELAVSDVWSICPTSQMDTERDDGSEGEGEHGEEKEEINEYLREMWRAWGGLRQPTGDREFDLAAHALAPIVNLSPIPEASEGSGDTGIITLD